MAVSETTDTDTQHSSSDGTQANAARCYEVRREDLPLSCPMPAMELWDSHPRVYLPIEETGREQCPYCGAIYILVESQV